MRGLIVLACLAWVGCDDQPSPATPQDAAPAAQDAALAPDAADVDATAQDAAVADATAPDAGPTLAWPIDGWRTEAPDGHGLDLEGLEALRAYVFRPAHDSQALLVIRHGVVVGEWYAADADADTPVTSWSVAKSVTSALIGIGVRDGLIGLDDPIGAHLDAWAEGPNAPITVRHLLQMRSGLTENTSNRDGIYLAEPDQLAYALDREAVAAPGGEFEYLNEDSMVLGGVVSAAFGRPAQAVAQAELFEPLGMTAHWWVDGAGHALTYCCIDSTARDFARFGLLFARGGAWGDRQIVPADYVETATTGVGPAAFYGLHWWTDRSGSLFAAIGLHDQYIIAIPEADLLVLRFGRYTQMGTERVRTGLNYHQTRESAIDTEPLVSLVLAMIAD